MRRRNGDKSVSGKEGTVSARRATLGGEESQLRFICDGTYPRWARQYAQRPFQARRDGASFAIANMFQRLGGAAKADCAPLLSQDVTRRRGSGRDPGRSTRDRFAARR